MCIKLKENFLRKNLKGEYFEMKIKLLYRLHWTIFLSKEKIGKYLFPIQKNLF